MIALRLIIYSVNPSNIEFYKKGLAKFNCRITTVSSHSDFILTINSDEADLIILDLDLDNTDAISVTKEIKQSKLSLAFITVCSNKVDDFIQISALNSGADDFINIPINPVIFELKIKSLINRLKLTETKEVPDFFVDKEKYKIVIGHNSYSLPRLEFKLIDLLYSHPNKVFSKDEIAEQIWHNKEVSSKRTIDIHIRNIRKELGAGIIKTYRGLGYSFKKK